jgi:hypothetical protein
VLAFIPIEVQGSYAKEFPRRMFDYNTAVYKLQPGAAVRLQTLNGAIDRL